MYIYIYKILLFICCHRAVQSMCLLINFHFLCCTALSLWHDCFDVCLLSLCVLLRCFITALQVQELSLIICLFWVTWGSPLSTSSTFIKTNHMPDTNFPFLSLALYIPYFQNHVLQKYFLWFWILLFIFSPFILKCKGLAAKYCDGAGQRGPSRALQEWLEMQPSMKECLRACKHYPPPHPSVPRPEVAIWMWKAASVRGMLLLSSF